MSQHYPRTDAIRHNDRWYVPTIWGQPSGNTQWITSWSEFRNAGGITHFSADQTEIVLTLPAGFKFGISFQDKPDI